MHIILIPGLWFDGSLWEHVVPVLEAAGHHPHPLTLPGMESADADREAITLDDHVGAVVAAIDACDPGEGKVVVIGHSAGCALAYAAVDARPERVAHVIYVGGFPLPDGRAYAPDFPVVGHDVPLPDLSEFTDDDLAGFDDDALAAFVARAVPVPAGVAQGIVRLSNPARYDVPATTICSEYSSDDLKAWIAEGAEVVSEFPRLRSLAYVDLPTSHWPQLTKPVELGEAILRALDRYDAQGRLEPPWAGDELENLVGFLEFQRDTFAWKTAGLDAAGLQATVGKSEMTLGGMLKHMALVEDGWFTHKLHGRERSAPFHDVDWDADWDWDWHSAAADTPDELQALWRTSVARSRAALGEALADGGLDRLAARAQSDGRAPNVRWILAHMIEEYARHNGHADLIRESIDGRTGE
jgi:pimeloyl-ACP methyl ester carboxylesterase/uncharacterized damage-inducible protein DinB